MKSKTNTLLPGFIYLCFILNYSSVFAKDHQSINGHLTKGLTLIEWESIKGQVSPKSQSLNKSNENDKSINNSALEQTSYIKASNTEAVDLFGYAVAISGDTLVVSAVEEDGGASGVNGDESDNSVLDSGAVYVFVKENGNWIKQAYLKASNPGVNDWFGEAVAISGDTIVISALNESSNATGVNGNQVSNGSFASGAAYVFFRDNGIWSQQAYLKASNTSDSNQFGSSVSISGDLIVVTSLNEDSNAIGVNGDDSNELFNDSGAAYVFVREGNNWEQQAYLKASNTKPGMAFGSSVGISGNTIAIGAKFNSFDINGNFGVREANNSGAVYVYVLENGMWRQEANLKASNPGMFDIFGNAVAVSGDTLVVSAIGEDSSANGLNGNETNDDSEESGAAYVFTRINGEWVQQAYLKASNTGAGDAFGNSVAISGNTIVVGAFVEDSNAMEINGHQLNDMRDDSGAVYVFNHIGGVWVQSHYVKASNANFRDGFGSSIAIDGNTFLVGTEFEDSGAIEVDGDQIDNSERSSGAAYVFEISQGFEFQAAHSALYYNPEQNGHGINVYMLADNRILVFWYVYDNEGKQVWLLGVGTHDGTKAILDVTFNDGAMFPPNFDSTDVNTVSWGQFELEFSDCNDGLFKWFPLADNGFTAGETTVTRLTSSLGLSCSESNTKNTGTVKVAEPSLKAGDFAMQAAHSALWYNPEQNGHGINVYLLADNRILVFWYVYDEQGNQVWLLGVGSHDGDKANLDVTVTSGAMFPPDFNTNDVNSENWGQFELEFSGCNDGVFRWLPSEGNGFTSGETEVVRLNATMGLTCIE